MIDVSNGVPGVNAPDPTSYEEFWPYYVSQHLHPRTRKIHVVATTIAVATGIAAMVLRKPKALLVTPVLGYGPAWFSHFVIEKNKPASFGHATWSAMADFEQVAKFYAGSLDQDVATVRAGIGLTPAEITLADREELRPAA